MTRTYNDIMTKYFMTKQQPKLHRDQDPASIVSQEKQIPSIAIAFYVIVTAPQILDVINRLGELAQHSDQISRSAR